MIVSFFVSSIVIQTTVFVVTSTIFILATRPLINKFVKDDTSVKTNVDAVVGKVGIVTKNIISINSTGQVKVDGETWSAIGMNGTDIEKGTKIIVNDIKGVKVVVTPKS